MSSISNGQPPSSSQRNQSSGNSISGMFDGLGGKVQQTLEGVAEVVDKERWRQFAFAFVVMPAITFLAISVLMPDVLHGVASMTSFGQGDFMTVPLLGLLVYGTGYCMVRTVIGKRDALRDLVDRIGRVAGLPLYLAGFSWFIFHVISLHGITSVHYSTPISQHTNFLYNINHPYSVQVGGIYSAGWIPMLALGTLPVSGLFKNMCEELHKIDKETNCQVSDRRAKDRKARARQLRAEVEVARERQAEQT